MTSFHHFANGLAHRFGARCAIVLIDIDGVVALLRFELVAQRVVRFELGRRQNFRKSRNEFERMRCAENNRRRHARRLRQLFGERHCHGRVWAHQIVVLVVRAPKGVACLVFAHCVRRQQLSQRIALLCCQFDSTIFKRLYGGV